MKCRYSTFFIYIFTIGVSHFRMFLQHVEQFFPRREHHARRAERLHPVIPHPWNYPCRAVALEPSGVLQISKADYIKILNADPVFMFNYLNIISMNAQKSVVGLMSLTSGSLEERIAFWVIALTQPSGENIAIECPLRNLCAIWGVQRSALVDALTRMRDYGVESFGPSGVVFSSRKNDIRRT